MPRDGAIIFSDLIGKLDVLRVACAKCSRAGRYRLDSLIECPEKCRCSIFERQNLNEARNTN